MALLDDLSARYPKRYAAAHYAPISNREIAVFIDRGREFFTVRGEPLENVESVARALKSDGEVVSFSGR